jgi:hypothetical protein
MEYVRDGLDRVSVVSVGFATRLRRAPGRGAGPLFGAQATFHGVFIEGRRSIASRGSVVEECLDQEALVGIATRLATALPAPVAS